MSIVVLDGMEGSNAVSDKIKEMLSQSGKEYSYFELKAMNILPCRSCGACGFKSPGKCVLKDDSHDVLRAIAKCSTMVMLTPIRFGGYSSNLKKIVDKFMTLGLPSYTVKNGHMLHPMRYGSKAIIGVGVYDGDSEEQKASFRKLLEHNAFNMSSEFKAYILKPSRDTGELEQQINSMVKEAVSYEQ
jgi:multimeric flavodoxin WrbA